ncbi:alpha/beta-hydrolase [Vararia minispora EC-137]|uniref:Alpha/beta-hydrolase n=1 Tax=Vararia minispora EC-137 TaxID=1314806 RepID=A0ACB8QHL7_9AGAM|nr:alpha/beta-hydrolase [Vararia minispora EC-137]
MTQQIAPFGTWTSPITTDALVQKSTTLLDVIVDPVTRKAYYLERRPFESGRSVLVDIVSGKDVLDQRWNVTTRVHEYGGAAAVVYDGVVYFSHGGDDRAYCFNLTALGEPEAVTPANKPWRYADFTVHPTRRNILVSILEDHTRDTPQTVLNCLCIIDVQAKAVSTLVEGADFYDQPLFSPDGKHIVFRSWNHPDMPWQRSSLHIFSVVDTDARIELRDELRLTWDGGKNVAVGYAKWLDAQRLVFLSDVSGFYNPYLYDLQTKQRTPLLSSPLPNDFVVTSFRLGGSPYVVLYNDGKAVAVLFDTAVQGRSSLAYFDLTSKTLKPVDSRHLVATSAIRSVSDKEIIFISQSTTAPTAVSKLRLQDLTQVPIAIRYEVLKSSTASLDFPDGIISQPVPLLLNLGGGLEVHANYYPPTNPGFKGDPEKERPPCVVHSHGGPTGQAGMGLVWDKQYFTSRGWAWLDVDYSGSNGYGREYVDRLNGNWGVTDISDCVQAGAAIAAAPHNLVDPARLVIRGGSSGGFTTLAALCSFPDAFAAGTSLFGISDLIKLAEHSHKFENRYMEKLLGGSCEDVPEVYNKRSPVNNAQKIRSPLLILQGMEDKVVPPEQAEIIVKKIREQRGHVEFMSFEGEGHGWRKSETIKAALEAEIAFYEKMLKISVNRSKT